MEHDQALEKQLMRRIFYMVASAVMGTAGIFFLKGTIDHNNFKESIKEKFCNDLIVDPSKTCDDFAESVSSIVWKFSKNNIDLEKLDVIMNMADEGVKITQDEAIYLQKGKIFEFNETGDTVTLWSYQPEPVKEFILVLQNNTLD